MSPVEVVPGDSPVVLGLPHTGTDVPPAVWDRLNDMGRALADTDWHVERLYDGLLPGATTVRATFHRYVIDANRDPSGVSLYPGENTTGLVPLTDFDGCAIWHQPPTPPEIEARRAAFHAPYHAALAAELARVALGDALLGAHLGDQEPVHQIAQRRVAGEGVAPRRLERGHFQIEGDVGAFAAGAGSCHDSSKRIGANCCRYYYHGKNKGKILLHVRFLHV